LLSKAFDQSERRPDQPRKQANQGEIVIKLAIVGGGPGGLMSAYHVKKKIGDLAKVTIFEASERLGGKIVTRTFDTAPAMYEAGVAEIYGYSSLGPDPLRDLIEEFGLQTVPMGSDAVMIDGKIIQGVDGMEKAYGKKTANAIRKFRKTCGQQMSQSAYYEGVGKHDNNHAWMWETAEDVLNEEADDPMARKFFRVMARSDIASEMHVTNGLNALKNYLMDLDGYIDVFSIQNGNEQLVEGLKGAIDAEIQFNHRVLKVGKNDFGQYRLHIMNGKGPEERDFDVVLICLPHNWLGTIEWGNEKLRMAMSKHFVHFDRPAHYLRLAALFDKPFWNGKVDGSWFMSEAFGGCCIYIEGARHDAAGYGVLNWLISGSDALAFANLNDEQLADIALKTLPVEFGNAQEHLLEIKTHRWLASVNAIPGGKPVRDPVVNHVPEPKEHPGIIVVGDYLFDSTLNGLLDSADLATDMILSELMMKRYVSGAARDMAAMEPNPTIVPDPSPRIDRTYFDNYRALGPYAEVWHKFSDPDYIIDMVRKIWKVGPQFKMLVAGSCSGELVAALRERGIDAWGIENNRYIHGKTPGAIKPYNQFGTIINLPFNDQSFDFVYEDCLAYVAPRQTIRAVRELNRITRKGVYFASVTSDHNSDDCDCFDLLRGVKKLSTWWEWSEIFFNADFELTLYDDALLEQVWQRTLLAKKGPGDWYDDRESLRYCFFTRLDPDED
jgi:monoamine oxidase/SAM-dependent methyltransferase